MKKTITQTTDAGKSQIRNRILSITRNTIPYVKELRRLELVKSISACILMQQLDYWFDKYREGFYKFLEPCKHAAYKPGKSWTEELEITVDEFRGAFDQIGVRYSSKKEYDAAADKFAGKYYCSYYDKLSRMTHYFRNHEKVDADLDSLAQMDNSQIGSSRVGKDHPHIREVPTSTDGQSPSRESGSSNPDYKDITKDTNKDNTQESVGTTHSQVTNSSVPGSTVKDVSNEDDGKAGVDSTAIDGEDNGEAIKGEPVFDSKLITASNFVPVTGRAATLPEDFRLTAEMRAWAEANVQLGVDIDRATEKFKVYNHGKLDKDWSARWKLWMLNEKPMAAVNSDSGDSKFNAASNSRAEQLRRMIEEPESIPRIFICD